MLIGGPLAEFPERPVTLGGIEMLVREIRGTFIIREGLRVIELNSIHPHMWLGAFSL